MKGGGLRTWHLTPWIRGAAGQAVMDPPPQAGPQPPGSTSPPPSDRWGLPSSRERQTTSYQAANFQDPFMAPLGRGWPGRQLSVWGHSLRN